MACSPELNWRDVQSPEVGLEQLFPCKPVRQQRAMEFAGLRRQVVLRVCDAGGVSWAQTHVLVDGQDAAPSALRALVDAAHANLGAVPGQGKAVALTASATPWPAERFEIRGVAPDGRAVTLAVLVFSRGRAVVQVSALASALDEDAVRTFFESVKVLP